MNLRIIVKSYMFKYSQINPLVKFFVKYHGNHNLNTFYINLPRSEIHMSIYSDSAKTSPAFFRKKHKS